MKEVVIIGAGGHGRVVAEIVRANNDVVVGFLDDDAKGDMILGKVSDCIKFAGKYFIIGIGNNYVRKKISETFPDLNWYTAIHPTAVVSETAKIQEGTVVGANAVINTDSVIGKHSIINTAVVIEHDNTIGDFCHISPNATLCGTVTVGECTHIGAGATVKNNISIGKNITVGIGAAVVKNISDEGIYTGVPTRKIKGGTI